MATPAAEPWRPINVLLIDCRRAKLNVVGSMLDGDLAGTATGARV